MISTARAWMNRRDSMPSMGWILMRWSARYGNWPKRRASQATASPALLGQDLIDTSRSDSSQAALQVTLWDYGLPAEGLAILDEARRRKTPQDV
jgi:hypothetical protein